MIMLRSCLADLEDQKFILYGRLASAIATGTVSAARGSACSLPAHQHDLACSAFEASSFIRGSQKQSFLIKELCMKKSKFTEKQIVRILKERAGRSPGNIRKIIGND